MPASSNTQRAPLPSMPKNAQERLAQFLEGLGLGQIQRIEPLAAEASARRYFRLHLTGEPESVVLCKGLPRPYADQDGFVELAEWFARRGLPVPRVLAQFPKAGAILLSDAGKEDLSCVLNHLDIKRDSERRRALVGQGLKLLSRLQGLHPPPLIESRLFDAKKLRWEMDFLFSACRDIAIFLKLPDPVSFEMRSFCYQACQKLDLPESFVLSHRDFHARNLMLRGASEMIMIDFQDARMGLPVYDLASFLYDPYTPLTQQEREWAYAQFWKEMPAKFQAFEKFFYLQAMQRLLKALGSYLHLTFYKGHPRYIQSVPMALRYLDEVVQRGHLPDSVYLFVQRFGEDFVPRLLKVLGRGAPSASAPCSSDLEELEEKSIL